MIPSSLTVASVPVVLVSAFASEGTAPAALRIGNAEWS
jgi:hypothetical protein